MTRKEQLKNLIKQMVEESVKDLTKTSKLSGSEKESLKPLEDLLATNKVLKNLGVDIES